MTARRRFALVAGDQVFDEYTTAEGIVVGVKMPGAVIRSLTWLKHLNGSCVEARGRESESSEWAHRIRNATQAADISVEDGYLARRLATAESLVHLERIALNGGADTDMAARKARVRLAGVVCELNSCHTATASILVEALRSPHVEIRDAAAFAIGRAIRHLIHTPAMTVLLSAVEGALTAYASPGWPRFAYGWSGVLAFVEPRGTLRRCRQELERAAEDDRLWLVSAMAKYRNGEALTLLRRRLCREPSPRVGLRILVEVGGGVSKQRRQMSLYAALSDESPWWRWQAIQELWRIESNPAHELLTAALSEEPDPLLRDLMLIAMDALDLPETRARRLSVYG